MQKRRILVIDDEPALTRMLKLTLEQTQAYTVHTENDPGNVFNAAREFQPELILLDVMMPGMDGGDVAARLQECSSLKSVPVIFLTAAVKREEVASHGGVIGGFPYLAKPVDLKELLQCVEAHLPP